MNRRDFGKLGLLALASATLGRAQVNIQHGIMQPVLTRGYDNARSGCNPSESILTISSVGTQGIRKLFSLPMEGDARGAEAQTLICPSVTCDDGTTRDIAITAAMTNDIGVFDANDSDYIWMKKYAVPVNGTTNIDGWKINDHWGILSTPVVDQDTGYMYFVTWSSPNGNYANALHQMNVVKISNGDRVCAPVSLTSLTYTCPNGKVQKWNSIIRKQRSSLLLTNVNNIKTVFFASGTVAESSNGAAGWICAFDCFSNQFTATMTTTAGNGGGIWMGGGGLAADSKGLIYAMTGNGDFDGVNDFGECVIKVQYTSRYNYIPPSGEAGPGIHDNGPNSGKLQVIDWWCPWDDAQRLGEAPTTMTSKELGPTKLAGKSQPSEEMRAMPNNKMGTRNFSHIEGDKWFTAINPADAAWSDEDLGSAGVTIFEDLGIVLACGKDGIAYLVNMNNMGKTKPTDLTTAAGIAANYAKLVQEPQWFTYFPGYNTAANPADPTTLNFMWQGKTRHMHSTPVSRKNADGSYNLFCWGENSSMRAWKLTKAGLQYLAQSNELASANVTQSPGGMPGGFMAISCNGTKTGTGILVATIPYGDGNKTVTTGRLLVYDAESFANGTAKVLWDSQAWGISFMFNKFNPPVISGGKIFVPTYSGTTDVYGLAA